MTEPISRDAYIFIWGSLEASAGWDPCIRTRMSTALSLARDAGYLMDVQADELLARIGGRAS